MTFAPSHFEESLTAKLAVIADDLTGACDTACQFALYGFLPEVVMHSAGCCERQAQVCGLQFRIKKG